MILQLFSSYEAFVTPWKWARKGLVSGMTVDMAHQLRLVAEVYGFRSLQHLVMFGAILPVAAIGTIFPSMVGLDMVVEGFRGLEAEVAWLVFMKQPTAAEVAVQGGRCAS